nr:MAG TPA: hypothetical protein [Caudoviricetes sp.]
MSEENVSLPVAQALASALEKIEAYVPTEYVDNSEPDIDAEHLNHAEQGIMRVTNLLNAAVDVIQGQESRLADAETKIGTAELTGGMTDLSSGLNSLNSNLNGFHVYANISDLGLSNGVTVNDILSKMPEPSMGFFYVFDNNINKLPITTQANLIIFKSGSASDIVERSIWTGETYFGKYGGANKVESWVLI